MKKSSLRYTEIKSQRDLSIADRDIRNNISFMCIRVDRKMTTNAFSGGGAKDILHFRQNLPQTRLKAQLKRYLTSLGTFKALCFCFF